MADENQSQLPSKDQAGEVVRDELGRWVVRPPYSAPLFKPGQSGRPEGRPKAGGSILEWLNEMTTWTPQQGMAVLSDPDASFAKVSAVRIWLAAASQDAQVAGSGFDRILDRTLGKSLARTEVSGPDGTPLQMQVDQRRKAVLDTLKGVPDDVLLNMANVLDVVMRGPLGVEHDKGDAK